MELKKAVILHSDGTIKGLYSGSEQDILIDVLVGETVEFVDDDYILPLTKDEILYNDRSIKQVIKDSKLVQISTQTVCTSAGKVFDGDEKSQDRMLRAIIIANVTGQTSTQWKLADNSIVEVTLDELKEALSLAGQEMSRIWLA